MCRIDCHFGLNLVLVRPIRKWVYSFERNHGNVFTLAHLSLFIGLFEKKGRQETKQRKWSASVRMGFNNDKFGVEKKLGFGEQDYTHGTKICKKIDPPP